jgi:16S rRNA (guanine527-N7)-methyltransferase
MSEKMRSALREMKIDFNGEMIGSFDTYMDEILRYNKEINLTAITDREQFEQKHYLDSLSVYGLEEYRAAVSVIDMGTGGGFPGVPLAIVSPEKEFTLADSLMKRLKVIDEITAEMKLANVHTVHGRAEDIGQKADYRAAFDLCVSRAVADMAVLAEYCLPLVKKGGCFVAYKTDKADQEVEAAVRSITTMGGEIDRIEKMTTAGMKHSLVVINKVADTPKKFPRKAGTPAKSPIR